jgi:type I restriction enzyme S subunit
MSWSTVKLGEICTIEKGQTGIQKAIPGVYPMVVTSEERKSHNEFQFDDEAVIIPLVSGTGHGHASIKRIHYQTGKFALGSILCAVIPKDKTVLNPEYLFRFLELNKENELVARMKGMANVTLPMKEIAKIEIPLPPLKKQIAFVDNYKILVEKNSLLLKDFNEQLNLITQLRQSFLREAIQGKLLNSKHVEGQETGRQLLEKIKSEKAKRIAEKKLKKEKNLPRIIEDKIPFEIPHHWTWTRLGDICDTITKGSSPKWQGVQYVDSPDKGILFITSKNVDSFKIDLTKLTYVESKFNEIEPRSILKKGDLLTNIVGASIGRTALYELDELANINQAVCILRIEHNLINKQFILNLMNSNFVIDLMLKMQFAPGRANLSMGNVANFTIPLPPLYEQEQIVAKLAELMSFCDSLAQSIKESQDYNEMLLEQVLREALQPKEEAVLDIDSLFEDKNYNLHVAMIQTLIESQLGINHGEVANQKTIFHINTFTNEKIPYQFVNHNFGTFSQQLRDDLSNNPYLTKTKKNNKEVFIVRTSKQKEVLDNIYKSENKTFVNAVKEILDIYELPFINKETDKIELLNTVSKVIQDYQASDIEVVYQGMHDWKINQGEFKSKADKFNKSDVAKMIKLIQNKGLESKLLQNRS